MNYAGARSLQDGAGWHYTVQNDGRTWAHVCCRDTRPATEEDVKEWPYGDLKVGDPLPGEPHAPHATKEEAEECYHEWRLRRVRETMEFGDDVFSSWEGCRAVVGGAADFEGDDPDRERTMSLCDAPTKGGARYRDDPWPDQVPLCEEHRSPEIVLSLVRRVSSQSYS